MMEYQSEVIVLENGLNLREVVTTGSILQINQEFDDLDCKPESDADVVPVDFIGEPVPNLKALEKAMDVIDQNGFVKKKILIEGGGKPPNELCTVSIAFSGYWEKELEPFDVRTFTHPMEVDLKDHGLLPGLEMAVKSMLVGETSVFILSYKVMYGEMGIPPRIKPKSDCVFYIKLIKSILTPKEGKIIYSEPNMFQRIHHEVKKLYSSATTLYKSNNYSASIQLFNKSIHMLHKCRLADEAEEKIQEKWLIKLYINLAVCYNKVNKPFKTCTACNELNRLNSMWNNGKVLYLNAKALRMIGAYTAAAKRLEKAMKLCPDSKEMKAELTLLRKTMESREKDKSFGENAVETIADDFKHEVDNIIRNFKSNIEENQLVFPAGLNSDEMDYLKEVCIRENLFFNKIDKCKVETGTESKGVRNLKCLEDYILHKPELDCSETLKEPDIKLES